MKATRKPGTEAPQHNKKTKTLREILFAGILGCAVFVGYPFAAQNESMVGSTWLTKTDMPTARFGLSGAVVDEKIYAIGGSNGERRFATVEEYDPATDTWTPKADMPTARGNLASATVNGKIYAFGGHTGISWGEPGTIYATVEEFSLLPDVGPRLSIQPSLRDECNRL